MLVVEPTQASDELLAPCYSLFNQVNQFRNAELINIAWRISRELQAPDAVSPLSVNGLVLDLLSVAVREAGNHRESSSRKPPLWLCQAKDLLHEHFRERLTITDLATSVNVHPVHLARTFRECYGVTVGVYVRQLRLDWAIAQITHSHKPLGLIAAQAGFTDQSHLTRVFRQHKGMTPGQYRKQLQR